MFHKFQLGKLRVLINQTTILNSILHSLKLKLIIDIQSYINYAYSRNLMSAPIAESSFYQSFPIREGAGSLMPVLKGEMNVCGLYTLSFPLTFIWDFYND